MRTTPLILGSSILIPPNSSNHFSTTPKSVPKLPSPPPNLSHSKTSSSPSARPLLSTVRWDLAFHRHQNSLNRYADLASKAAEVGNFDEFLVIAESVLVSGVKPFEFSNLLNVQLVSAGIAGMIEEGEIGRVVKVLSGAQKLGIGPCELFDGAAKETLQRECSRIAKCGKVEKLVDLIEILNGFHFSTKELLEPAEVIRICVAKGKPNVAIRYARSFPNAHILFCNMILEFGKNGDFVSALCTFEASKQDMDCPNMYIYRTIIDVCGLCGDYLRSRSIYEDLLTQKVTPNIYVFNSLMNVNARDLSYTLHIYKHMQNLGIAADMTSYNILLKSCCRASRVDLAQDIYREVRHLESTGALKLDFYTYSTIIKAFADAKMWQMALEIKDDMLAAGVAPNTITWSSLINACASAGLVEKAILLFEEMLLADCKPNSQCFNIVLHACVEACQYDRAFRLFHIWKGRASKKFSGKDCPGEIDIGGDYSHKSCTTVVPDCGSNSDRVNFTMRVPFTPTTVTYNIMMKACGTDYRRAKALMNEMKTLGLSPNQRSWSILIDIVGRSRNVEGAVQILTSMRESGLQPDVIAYTATIKVCVQNKHLKFAFSLFEEMKRYQLQPNLVTYNTLLRARSRYGSLQEVQQCLAIYQDMRKAGYKANDYYLKQLIEEWCEGILQGNNQNQGQHSSRSRTDLGGPQSLLLEKVAVNLQKTDAEIFAVDLQGLTKVEARIVVLAVLRMIKENYTPGKSVKDDILIILGVQEVGSVAGKCNFNVKDAIIELLRVDLGLEVLSAEHKSATKRKIGLDNPSRSHPNFETGTSGLPTRLESPTRRPADLQRLEVTRKSLYNWLQKRFGYSKS